MPPAANPLFWLIFVSAALIGLVIAYPAHLWMVKRELAPWRALVAGERTPTRLERPPRLKTLGAIVLTYVVLIGVIVTLLSLIN